MTSRPRDRRRLLASPLTVVALTVLVFGGVIWAVQTRFDHGDNGSVVQRIASRVLPQRFCCVLYPSTMVIITGADGELQAVGDWEEAWERVQEAAPVDDVLLFSCFHRSTSHGLLSAFIQGTGCSLHTYGGSAWRPELVVQARTLAVARLAEVESPQVIAALEQGDVYEHRRIRTPLLLVDVLWVVALAGWVCALPPCVRRYRDRRRERRLRILGRCPSCGYDIRGLDGCTCPECGARWEDAETGEGVTAPVS